MTVTEHIADTLVRGSGDGPPAGRPPLFGRLARFSVRRRRWVIAVWLVVVLAAAPLALTLTSGLSGAGWEAQGSVANQVRDELRADFPELGAESAIVVYRQEQPIVSDPSGLIAVVDQLRGAPGTASVQDPLQLPPEAGMISPDGTTAMVPVHLTGDEDADLPESAARVIDHVAGIEVPDGARIEVTGEWPVWSDFNASNEEALHKAELLSGLPTIILLLVAFGSAVAAGLPLILAVAGIAVGFASLRLFGMVTPLSVWSMNFSMMIGLAVGIDYSLFIVSRYREEREDGHDAEHAMANTLTTAGKAVFLSALTVVLSLAAVFLVPVMVFRSMALGMILAVIAVALASLTLLPAVLAAMGDRVLVSRGHDDPDRAAEGRWTRWTQGALRRPRITLAAGLVLLLALAAPAIGMRLGMPGARVVDEGRSSRDGYEMVVSAFGPGAAAPVFITVAAADSQAVLDVAAADPGAAAASIVARPAESGRTVVRVIPTTAVDSAETTELVSRLRADVAEVAPGALVGGPAAQNHDLTDVLTGRAPLAIGVIMVVAFLLLLVVFRSLTIALFSIVLNLISVAAAFGFATIVFQHGIGAGLIGIEHQGFVDAWAPLFFFALLFGLSMDYQLFLLAAIRERYEHTGDTATAVREGIARTGRPITNAALIMIVVFIAFGVTGPIPPTELGVTLALAVLLDATIVRMMLVPSIMGLLGERNWWLPRWMGKRLPIVRFDH
ncbi:MAG TPA: MMPL family transporter [Microthrixaceae bacterium]|nr:MMPL family transporter [Microthrixaceae bacterium]RTL08700.1 MAG: MMPL family transporter [Acidimicrobiia bacterium]MCB9374716.1 MMPL family transporter [Microthrixaceae bacterium]MCB9400766.1 MMPL family transporter [Microthrixaceae bacterium]MCO5305448.1 MMPL family transporter [Microthrixaceae bacterium]